MKKDIHPKYVEATVTCGCGEKFTTRSTKKKINIGICSKCHPFFTGKQKFVDTAGQVEKFQKKFKWSEDKAKDVEKEKLTESRKAAMSHKKKVEDHRRKQEEAKARFKKAGALIDTSEPEGGKPRRGRGKGGRKAEGAPPAPAGDKAAPKKDAT